MTGTQKRVPTSILKRHSIRSKQRTREQLIALAESWLAMPIHPIVVRPDMTVADGHGRLEGLEYLGVTEVDVFITDQVLTDDELEEIGFITAYHREGLTPYDQAQIVIRKRKAGMPNQDIARKLNIDPGYASKLNSLSDCPQDVQDAAARGEIGPSDWYLISKSPDQLETLRLKLGGATVAELTRDRKKRQPKAPTVRTSKIKCPLPSGATVQVVGDEIDLEGAIEALGEAQKAMKAALAKGLNIKTAVNYWSDIAAAN